MSHEPRLPYPTISSTGSSSNVNSSLASPLPPANQDINRLSPTSASASLPRTSRSSQNHTTSRSQILQGSPFTPYAEKPSQAFLRERPPSPLMGKSYTWWRIKRLAARPLPWALIIVVGLITWWSAGATTEFDSEDVQSRLRELFPPEFTRDLQFFPASNHKIHVSLFTLRLALRGTNNNRMVATLKT